MNGYLLGVIHYGVIKTCDSTILILVFIPPVPMFGVFYVSMTAKEAILILRSSFSGLVLMKTKKHLEINVHGVVFENRRTKSREHYSKEKKRKST